MSGLPQPQHTDAFLYVCKLFIFPLGFTYIAVREDHYVILLMDFLIHWIAI